MFGIFKKKKQPEIKVTKEEVLTASMFRKKLTGEKIVKIDGLSFTIKKLNIEDHLTGLNIVYNIYSLYKKKENGNEDFDKNVDNIKKLKKFMRDFIYASVVKPELAIKDPVGEKIHVDEIMSNTDMAQKLCFEIITHSYGSKVASGNVKKNLADQGLSK